MKKLASSLLAAVVGAMFPAAFLLILVVAMHLMDGKLGLITVAITMVLPVGSWLLYRKLGHYE